MKHLIAIEQDGGGCKVIHNNDRIIENIKAIEIETNSSCEGTTPDCQIIFYENKGIIGWYSYCSFFITQSLDFGCLEKELVPAINWQTDSLSFENYQDSLKQYTEQSNIYIYSVKPVQAQRERVRYVMNYYKW